MASVCGQYVRSFKEASHVLFEGHLDDPLFRAVAIQKITSCSNKVVTVKESGELAISQGRHQEFVVLIYDGFFGLEKTHGYPFLDNKSKPIGVTGLTSSKGKEG